MNGCLPWPYAAKAVIQHEFDTDHLNIWITFRFPMDERVTPPLGVWVVTVDDVEMPVSASAWQDSWTLLLTVPDIASEPDRVTVEYEGPDENLRTNWRLHALQEGYNYGKQWEPWGPILSLSMAGWPPPSLAPDAWTDFFPYLVSGLTPWFYTILSSGSFAAINSTFVNHPGIFRFSSHASNANSGYSVYTFVGSLYLSGKESTELVFQLPENHENTNIHFGFKSNTLQGPPLNGLYTEIINTTLRGIAYNNSVQSLTLTTYALSVLTWYHLKLFLNDNADLATFELYNEVGVLLWSDTISTNLPINVSTGHVFVVYNTAPGGTIRNMIYADYMNFAINRTLVR